MANVIPGHWMAAPPLNRRAWPDYQTEAETAGTFAAALMRRAAWRSADPYWEALAMFYAREAARNAWIVIFGGMTAEELKNGGILTNG